MHRLWDKVKTEIDIWRVGALPGFAIIVFVALARLTGSLQFLELIALDNFLRVRPPEQMDERIVIVTLTQEDINKAGTYPIPDKNLADLLRKIKSYKPNVIGLDIFRDKPVNFTGEELCYKKYVYEELSEVFRNSENIIAIEQALIDGSGYTVAPPPAIHPDQVGFTDGILDPDGYLRRSLLGGFNSQGEFRFSLTIKLAVNYLYNNKNIHLKNGIKDIDAFRFGSTELTRFQPIKPFPEKFYNHLKKKFYKLPEMSYYGGYVGADAGGNQILLNYRSGKNPFRIISVGEINAGKLKDGTKIKPQWIRNRIVLVGIAALSAKDVVNTSAVGGVNPALVYGVEAHAHAVSQIISAVIDKRPLIQVWSIGWEYLWIFGWGILGISLGRFLRSPWKIFLGLGIASGGLVFISYGLILIGLWVPIVPSLLVLLNAAGLTVLTFHQYEYTKSRLEEKESIIQQIVQSIHNEPMQTLKLILKDAENLPQPLLFKLQHLHQELEAIKNSIPREILNKKNSFQLGSGMELDLEENLHELLHLVYADTLEPKEAKHFPCFQTIKVKVIKFEPLNDRNLSLEDKRGLCRFLQEALINVGKYARGVTRLTVICKQEQNKQVIRVTDNGVPLDTSVVENSSFQHVGTGTKQAKRLAKRLGGEFRRYPNQTKGTVCELTWTAVKSWLR